MQLLTYAYNLPNSRILAYAFARLRQPPHVTHKKIRIIIY